MNIIIAYLVVALPTQLLAEKVTLTSVASDVRSVEITVELGKGESIVADTITFATSNPQLPVTKWHTAAPQQTKFDPVSNLSRHVYTDTVVFSVELALPKEPVAPTTLFMHYFASSHKYPQEKQFNIVTETKPVAQQQETPPPLPHNDQAQQKHQGDMPVENKVPSALEHLYESLHQLIARLKENVTAVTTYLSQAFTTSSSVPFQAIIALLLGLLMSLTPCIYPMIPITVGLLGASTSNSWSRNFLLAGSYTCGMALVFAILGLVTVAFGAQCGKLMCNPWFVALLILFLGYCGGSMLGLYDFYIPRFLQPTATQKNNGSLISAFLFGAISGTFASPCMSPGLALILTAVAQLGNTFLGFLLLFAFGIGVSTPLLIIGTFSGALHFLPRAGLWMNDIKQFFGFMLIMMCFYYAQALVPLYLVLGAAAAFSILCGSLYIVHVRYARTPVHTLFIMLISTLLITGGLFTAYRGVTAWYATKIAPQPDLVHWKTNYDEARTEAQNQHKYILADFTASWCPMCVLLDKEVLQNPATLPVFDKVIAVKIDGSSQGDAQFNKLTQQFAIFGIPRLLLIDAETEKVVASWSSELLDKPATHFHNEVLKKIK